MTEGTSGGAQGRVLVIVPAFNEERSVGDVVRRITAAGYPCVVVDDGSSDDTSGAALAAGGHLLRLPFNLGVGGALGCGFRYAIQEGYDLAVQCDGDGQHPPEQIVHLLDVQRATGAHLTIGSRFVDGSEFYEVGRTRRLLMRCLSGIARAATGMHLADTTSGFRCIAAPLLGEFALSYPLHYLGDTFEAAVVAARSGYLVVETPIEIQERRTGVASARPIAALTFLLRAVVATSLGLTFKIHRAPAIQP